LFVWVFCARKQKSRQLRGTPLKEAKEREMRAALYAFMTLLKGQSEREGLSEAAPFALFSMCLRSGRLPECAVVA
jgi:hypothetical protein